MGLTDISQTGRGEGAPEPGSGCSDFRVGGYGDPTLNERNRWAASACLHLLIINVIFESPKRGTSEGG